MKITIDPKDNVNEVIDQLIKKLAELKVNQANYFYRKGITEIEDKLTSKIKINQL